MYPVRFALGGRSKHTHWKGAAFMRGEDTVNPARSAKARRSEKRWGGGEVDDSREAETIGVKVGNLPR